MMTNVLITINGTMPRVEHQRSNIICPRLTFAFRINNTRLLLGSFCSCVRLYGTDVEHDLLLIKVRTLDIRLIIFPFTLAVSSLEPPNAGSIGVLPQPTRVREPNQLRAWVFIKTETHFSYLKIFSLMTY